MIDRQHGEIVFICDGCDEFMETGEKSFDEANAQFRASDWTREKVGTEWTHLCPDCQEAAPCSI